MSQYRFPAYVQIGKQRYRERFGLDFEDFTKGQLFRHRPGVTISQQDNKEECINTLNQAMLHFDDYYAAQTEFGKPLIDTTLIVQHLMGMIWKTYNRRKKILGWGKIAMVAPVFGGDTLYSESEVIELQAGDKHSETGLVRVAICGLNQDKKVVCEMGCDLLIYKRNHLPFSANGY
ncbi:MaoC family dehydratase [Microbulbifer sp. OS29]|uniref:MaoC family dehydratase n=1 Tax=Microbulbifer okhotskensis TaxID=2926617 RepID=A0A9X2ERR2_9GAMM|nr:MaoC family dehydratase [Microbulbifer okhotskensis]MCO1334523.1 MaoC family dehydratase [Microbulbifer okhotskensis]